MGQVRALLAAAASSDRPIFWTAYVTTAVEGGMQPGELTGLTWEDVDFEAGTITIRHSLKRASGKPRLAELKTEWSGGVLTMPARTHAALLALFGEQAAERVQLSEHYGIGGPGHRVLHGRGAAGLQAADEHALQEADRGSRPRPVLAAEGDQAHRGVAAERRGPADRGSVGAGPAQELTRSFYRHVISSAPAARTAATMDAIDLAASEEMS